ncbi:hypothetical protein [Sphingomonas sp. R86521]|uniref:hypothetical protein n=1 Tax=Sphingomonas sp. R86521 TaxID=3093860 RepID=UPI0036D2E31D
MITRPTNLLFANTATFTSAPKRRATTRRIRSTAAADVHRIGVIDYDAKAGLLFGLLQKVNRSQERYMFYPVEAPLPTGLGRFSAEVVAEYRARGRRITEEGEAELLENVLVDDFQPHLSSIRSKVGVDMIVGVVAPMLAWTEADGRLRWNFFAVGEGSEAMVSAYHLREFAIQAKRTFEASVAMLIMAQVWSSMFDIEYHDECRGCLFDYCENRSDLTSALRRIIMDPECLAKVPNGEREHVEKCLAVIREYKR